MKTAKTGPRFFIEPSCFDHASGLARCDEARLSHQVRNVLRLKEGDCVQLLDGLGNIWPAVLLKAGRTYIEFSLSAAEEQEKNGGQPATPQSKSASSADSGSAPLNLISCLPLIKAHRFEWALEKLCELGVGQILPFQSDRCVVKIKSGERSDEGRTKRWQAICKEAAEQCERLRLPQVSEPLTLSDLLAAKGTTSSLKLLLSERNDQAPDMVSTLYNHLGRTSPTGDQYTAAAGVIDVVILAGPEGGFTDGERALIASHHFLPVSLGATILRSETACIAAAAVASAINVSKH
ncbi:MAG: 16S rRNA (uracil(1498)-N(3))-methyltransferase [Cyanobacteria bacterium SZAS LIN-3]|nr:16S rRNA (uracil(1498)-N(3))-methyltransferase [Cyanobacteria bacterium SZAS LIN-3]